MGERVEDEEYPHAVDDDDVFPGVSFSAENRIDVAFPAMSRSSSSMCSSVGSCGTTMTRMLPDSDWRRRHAGITTSSSSCQVLPSTTTRFPAVIAGGMMWRLRASALRAVTWSYRVSPIARSVGRSSENRRNASASDAATVRMSSMSLYTLW